MGMGNCVIANDTPEHHEVLDDTGLFFRNSEDLANQMRLILHTAAYWLVHMVRGAIPKMHGLASAEFATIRLRLLKVAARVSETATRVRLAFAAGCPDAAMFRGLADALYPRGP